MSPLRQQPSFPSLRRPSSNKIGKPSANYSYDDVGWWRDSLTLTFYKRTIRGKASIIKAWQALSLIKKSSGFARDGPGAVELDAIFLRLAPELVTLDVPFSFHTSNTGTKYFGLAKLVPVEKDGQRTFNIWILVTGAASLSDRPFEKLPRERPSLIDISQRGHPEAQGLPNLKAEHVLDAVVVGASSNPVASGNWATRYHGITIHHCQAMIQLPQFPFLPDDGYAEYLTGPEITRYCGSATEKLKLPVFAGVKVQSNKYDKEARLWRVRVQDVASGEQRTVSARNLVVPPGWLLNADNIHIPSLKARDMFKGPVQHTEEYRTAEPYKGKKVVVVGTGNSAHDVAKDLALNGAESVTLLQRSPTVLADFSSIARVIEAPYRMSPSADAADVVSTALPTAVMRDMMGGLLAMKIQENFQR